jgi:hypothetical protein
VNACLRSLSKPLPESSPVCSCFFDSQCAHNLIPVSFARPSPQDPTHPVDRCNLIQRPSQSGATGLFDAQRLRDHIRYTQPLRGRNIQTVAPIPARQHGLQQCLRVSPDHVCTQLWQCVRRATPPATLPATLQAHATIKHGRSITEPICDRGIAASGCLRHQATPYERAARHS